MVRVQNSYGESMSLSSIRVGLPVDGGRRQNQRGGLKWIAGSRPQKKTADRGLSLRRSAQARPDRPSATVSAAPVMSISDIESGPLSFLSSRQTMLLATVALVAVLVVWGLVRSNHQAIAHSYELSHLTQQKLNLLEANRQLQSELSRVSSLVHLEEAAHSALGLITPEKGQIVVID